MNGQSCQSCLIKRTQYEKFLAKVSEENDIIKKSALCQRKKDEIRYHLLAVYNFMTACLEMPERPITIEEFEITDEKLKDIAKNEISKLSNRLFHPFKTRRWRYYLDHGSFKYKNWKSCYGGKFLTIKLPWQRSLTFYDSKRIEIMKRLKLDILADEMINKKNYS